MTKINFIAICIAFAAEYIADSFIDLMIVFLLSHGTLSSDMDPEAFNKAARVIANTGAFLTAKVFFGTATTVGAGYLAARIAKTYPYYNGLGVGLIGLIFCIVVWGDLLWLNIFAVLSTVPVSIYGAHLAKLHMAKRGPA
jgi:hypothetical protein